MTNILKVLPANSGLKIGVKIGDQIYIGIPGGAKIDSKLIKKIEGDLRNE
jgi:hypothetical protein